MRSFAPLEAQIAEAQQVEAEAGGAANPMAAMMNDPAAMQELLSRLLVDRLSRLQ